jgi:hypothetical protein
MGNLISSSNTTSTTGLSSVAIIAIVVVSIILLIFVGLEFSRRIVNFTELIIFWFLYGITIFTIVNIIICGYFYLNIQNKRGPAGERGDVGEAGDDGEAGACPVDCVNKICNAQVMDSIVDQINKEAGNPDPPIKLNNLYIKQRVKQMCGSAEYNEISPYRGAGDLINYIKKTWGEWISLIYKAGGRQYFESIGAENEWKWVKANPFNEIKKYDLFYWGMDKSYRPRKISKCDSSAKGQQIPSGQQKGYPELTKPDVNNGGGFKPIPQVNKKYSIQTYLNLIPEGYLTHELTNTRFYIKSVSSEEANVYEIKQYNPVSKKYDLCISLNKGIFRDVQCNTIDKSQNWKVLFTGNADHEVRLVSKTEELADSGASGASGYLNIQPNQLDQSGLSLTFSNATDADIRSMPAGNDGTLFIMSVS